MSTMRRTYRTSSDAGPSSATPRTRPHRAQTQSSPKPPWQPDDAVTSCPVCAAAFTLLNRRHHCRKCGRVVCAACSMHRITIPREYIVQRPEEARYSLADLLTGGSPATDNNDAEDTLPPNLGGGRLVRVCTPCITPRRAGDEQRPLAPPIVYPWDWREAPLPPVPRPPRRPRLADEDVCPVCFGELPPRDDPRAREAHIEACITRVAAPAPAHPGRLVPVPDAHHALPVHLRMAKYTATEKDCLDGEGRAAECAICLEDIETGVDMGRLSCLCVFHEGCIRAWWERRGMGSCPLHQVQL